MAKRHYVADYYIHTYMNTFFPTLLILILNPHTHTRDKIPISVSVDTIQTSMPNCQKETILKLNGK